MEEGRKFMVFQEESTTIFDCDTEPKSDISTLTFLNFLLATASIVANVNSNSNNNNNNNNNNNDLNVNVASSNNNVKNENTVTFRPATGRRKKRSLCDTRWQLAKPYIDALEVFLNVRDCQRDCDKLCSDHLKAAASEPDAVRSHLIKGAVAMASGGQCQ